MTQCTKNERTYDLVVTTGIPYSQTRVYLYNKTTLAVSFVELIEESRCPSTGHCAWEGRAVINLQINQKDIVTIGIGDLRSLAGDTIQNTVFYGKRAITLKKLEFSEDEYYGVPRAYKAKIIVE